MKTSSIPPLQSRGVTAGCADFLKQALIFNNREGIVTGASCWEYTQGPRQSTAHEEAGASAVSLLLKPKLDSYKLAEVCLYMQQSYLWLQHRHLMKDVGPTTACCKLVSSGLCRDVAHNLQPFHWQFQIICSLGQEALIYSVFIKQSSQVGHVPWPQYK